MGGNRSSGCVILKFRVHLCFNMGASREASEVVDGDFKEDEEDVDDFDS
jgi:hypothetical protein